MCAAVGKNALLIGTSVCRGLKLIMMVAGCGTATKWSGTQQSKGRTTCRDSGTAKPSTGLVPSEENHTQDAPKPRREILEKAKSRGQKSDHRLPDVRLWGKELTRNGQEVTLERVIEHINVSQLSWTPEHLYWT